MTGMGQYYYKSLEQVYEGEFSDGYPHGKGLMKSKFGCQEGYFKNGVLQAPLNRFADS